MSSCQAAASQEMEAVSSPVTNVTATALAHRSTRVTILSARPAEGGRMKLGPRGRQCQLGSAALVITSSPPYAHFLSLSLASY